MLWSMRKNPYRELKASEGSYTITGISPMATFVVKLTARDSADNETMETKEVVANGVIIIIPP